MPDERRWQPSASLEAIQRRSARNDTIRAFFANRRVLEVETPALGAATVTDPHVGSLDLRWQGHRLYLQTSPECHMKRLLAAGSGPIYQIARVFRDDEAGRWHNPEFTMLEWYRPGFDSAALISEIFDLFRQLTGPAHRDADNDEPFQTVTYAALFEEYLGVDVFRSDAQNLADAAQSKAVPVPEEWCDAPATIAIDDWLDFLMAVVIGPLLGKGMPMFVTDYPVSQAAMAKTRGEPATADRFEMYWRGVEIANGYAETTDAELLAQRFVVDRQRRQQMSRDTPESDHALLAAMQAGLPECAGVALGLDRLYALLDGEDQLAGQLAFPIDRA